MASFTIPTPGGITDPVIRSSGAGEGSGPGALPIVLIEDVKADALARILYQYRDSTRLKELLAGLVVDQDLEQTAYDMVTRVFSIDSAEGAQLDIVASLVGAERAGRTDAAFRPILRTRILVNNSNGLIEDLLSICQAWTNDYSEGAFRLKEAPPASLNITATATPLDDAQGLFSRLSDAKAAGVRISLIHVTSSTGNDFRFASTYAAGPEAGGGFGSYSDPAAGSSLASVIQ